MDPLEGRHHIILTLTVISLLIAILIVIFFSAAPDSGNTYNDSGNAKYEGDINISDQNGTEQWIIRVMWFDDSNMTYTFEDYKALQKPEPDKYIIDHAPPLPGAKPAMIRYLSWDGTFERTIETQYLVDQDTVTSILNRYSLKASYIPPAPIQKPETPIPLPTGTASPGSIIPELGAVCRNADGTYTATFGYFSRNEQIVEVPIGLDNYYFPGEKDRGQPVYYKPGSHHEAFSITYPDNVTNQVWTIMGRQVSAGTVPEVTTNITVDPLSGYAPLEIRLNRKITGDTADNPLTGSWNFGDGTVNGDAQFITHRYEKPGIYNIRHSVNNTCNEISDEKTIRVYKASFAWNPDPSDPDTIRFFDTSQGEPQNWFWDFSDGNTSLEKNPSHTFSHSGPYNIGLKVSGKNGKGNVAETIVLAEN